MPCVIPKRIVVHPTGLVKEKNTADRGITGRRHTEDTGRKLTHDDIIVVMLYDCREVW
jgi:hypothetical protein